MSSRPGSPRPRSRWAPPPSASACPSPEPTDERTEALRASTPLSRSGGRKDADRAKEQDPARAAEGQSEDDLSDADPREIGLALLPEYGFSTDQFSCLDALYVSESDWRVDADNPTSSAYGIPQALTAMHDLPPGYFTDAEVQIRWGLEYIAGLLRLAVQRLGVQAEQQLVLSPRLRARSRRRAIPHDRLPSDLVGTARPAPTRPCSGSMPARRDGDVRTCPTLRLTVTAGVTVTDLPTASTVLGRAARRRSAVCARRTRTDRIQTSPSQT